MRENPSSMLPDLLPFLAASVAPSSWEDLAEGPPQAPSSSLPFASRASDRGSAFAEVASELPSMVDEKNPVKVVYSASYKEVPLAADLGVKSPPAILLLKPGQEPVAMAIPRNRKEFTEDSLTDWVTGELDKK